MTDLILARALLGLDPADGLDPEALADLHARAEAIRPPRGRKPSLAVALARVLPCPVGHAPAGQPCKAQRGHWLCAARLAQVGVKLASGTSRADRGDALAPGRSVIVQMDLLDVPGRLVERAGPRSWRVRVGDKVVTMSSKRLRCKR